MESLDSNYERINFNNNISNQNMESQVVLTNYEDFEKNNQDDDE